MSKTDTQPHTTPALTLWKAIFSQDGARTLLCIARLNQETREWKEEFFRYPQAASAAAEYALKWDARGWDVYFGAHLLMRASRKKENAAPLKAAYVDSDGAPLPEDTPPPTAVVRSGGPANVHAYWALESETEPERVERINKAIARATGADPSGYDLSQVLRVPGTHNHKPEYGEPRPVELAECDGLLYTPEQLLEAFPPVEVQGPAKPSQNSVEVEDEPPIELDPQALAVWRGELPVAKNDGSGEVDRSKTLLHIGRVLYDRGLNRSGVIAALKERDAALGYDKYTDRADAEERYAGTFEELERNGRGKVVRLIRSERTEPREPALDPVMEDAAYRGLFGDMVRLAQPHVEGDPAALLLSAIVAFGNAIGHGPYIQIGATKHRPNLFAAIVGDTSKARKGTTWAPIEDIMRGADEVWAVGRVSSGLSSGEGLINEVRDDIEVPDAEGNMKIAVPGVDDKRLLVMEGELSQALKVMKREGNTLSPVLRNAWDGVTLKTMVKHNPLRATDPHISVLGHITTAELVRHLTETEMANGLANRFLWAKAKRSQSLPFGGEWHKVDVAPLTRRIRELEQRHFGEVRMDWSKAARPGWARSYDLLTADRPGMFGAITARAEAQALRLSMLYAIADGSRRIEPQHVESALAVWQYCEASARQIFGDALGDPDADKVAEALKDATDGMTRTEISALFSFNKGREQLDRIRDVLVEAHKITARLERREGSKRRVEIWRALN